MDTTSDEQNLRSRLVGLCREIEALGHEEADEWLFNALDIEWHGTYRSGEWVFDHAVVLVTYGGPDVHVVWSGEPSSVAVLVQHGGRSVTSVARTVALPALLAQWSSPIFGPH